MKTALLMFVCAALLGAPQACGQRQGVKGEVLWLSGNQMPGPGRSVSPGLGIKREIYIHKVATLQNTQQNAGFFTAINTELVATTTSREDGSFKVKLPPGTYSVLVKEPGGLFANLFDDMGRINPVIVKSNEFTWLTVTVDYEAAF